MSENLSVHLQFGISLGYLSILFYLLLVEYICFCFQVFCLLSELDPEFIQQFVSRRELLFLSYLPITPNCHRVVETSHAFADGPKLSFVSCFSMCMLYIYVGSIKLPTCLLSCYLTLFPLC